MRGTKPLGKPEGTRRDRGFTLLEVVIAGSILVIIVAIAARTLAAGNSLLGAVSREVSGDVAAQQIVTQIADRIRNGVIADVEHGGLGGSPPFPDPCTWGYYGLKVRLVKSFKGGMEKGKTVWISEHLSDPYNPASSAMYSFDRTDNDRDGLIDEQMLRIREYAGDDDDVGATFTDQGMLADNLGLIYTSSAPAGEFVGFPDPKGVWDPSDTAYQRYIYPGLYVTRKGDTLTILVGVLRRDPQNLGKNRNPTIRCYMAKTTVTLRN